MKIICLKGGLGNQLFEYCRYRQLLEAGEKHVFMFRDFRRLKQHHHLLISQCFDIDLPPQHLWVTLVTFAIKKLRALHLWPILYDDSDNRCVLIDCFSQDKRYISKSQQLLRFRDLKLTETSRQYLSSIKTSPYPVAIHIRRGDYLLAENIQNFGVCDTEYHQKAIDIVLKHHPEAQFFLFSDDMEWVCRHLLIDHATYITKEQPEHDHIDLFLMAHCKAHIIANSTFSFWGSMLADHAEHLCIYPKRWFSNPAWTTPDIFPSHWIAL